MPRASKPQQPDAQTGPRLVKRSSPKQAASSSTVSPEQIATRAYELFESSGYAHGNDLEHWLAAERELSGAAADAPKTISARTRR